MKFLQKKDSQDITNDFEDLSLTKKNEKNNEEQVGLYYINIFYYYYFLETVKVGDRDRIMALSVAKFR